MAASAWTDERLDDLSGRVDDLSRRTDAGFARVDAELRDVRVEMRGLRTEIARQTDQVRSDLTLQIDALRGLTIRLSLGTTLAILIAIVTRSL